ncbi:MAG: cytochrome c oxidase subunit II [Methylococcaceae bacterium]
MALAVVLMILVVGSILFHFWSPWWITPLSSNWSMMDDTLTITFIVTGVVFVAVNVFLAVALIRFRHSKGRKAAYDPENKKLEIWLTGLTTVGVVVMLAPGLIVYADFVIVPKEAAALEVLAKQWQWGFRFPGKDKILGNTHIRFITFDNPFGINPEDPNGQDDVLIANGELHLPIDKPVQVVLRSIDVLHDFYVPHFRVKMDAVPGIVTSLWFTPTKLGRYDIACAEYCGMGHHTMHNFVEVDNEQDFLAWQDAQPTFAELATKTTQGSDNSLSTKGQQIAQEKGCFGCHSIDGNSGAGPTWKGLYGKTETLTDGNTIVVDEAYLKESIANPKTKVVKGYANMMPAYDFSEEEMAALIAYTKQLGSDTEKEEPADQLVQQGKTLVQSKGCLSCHSIDGSGSVGPTWQGLFGKTEQLDNNETVEVDESYLTESIRNPNAAIVKGYSASMPPYDLSDEEIKAMIAYTKTL